MSWFDALRTTVGARLGRGRVEREMNEEMSFHVEMETRRNVERGMSLIEARRIALRDFGGVERLKEEVRDERDARPLEQLVQDARYAARTLRRRPAFTAVATLTLALGIGATTALFGVVKAVLLTPLPYDRPASLVMVWSAWKGFNQTWLSYDEYEGWKDGIKAFSDVAIYTDDAVNLTEGNEPERLRAGSVTRQTFDVLGVRPEIGRGFTTEEDRPNGPNVVILGHDIWQRRFGADPAIIGRTVEINGAAAQVVGVMPAGFRLPLDFGADGATQIWRPLATDAQSEGAVPGPIFQRGGGSHGFYGIARLTTGATARDANRQLDGMVKQLKADGYISKENGFHAFAVPMETQVTGQVRPALLIVFGAVAFVLLIACANVAGLLLVRGEGRRRELALRVALGAGGSRLTRQLLTETLVLTSIGAGLGIALAALAVRLIRVAAPATFPRIAETRLDPAVLGFAVAIALTAALLTGILPALQAMRLAPGAELKEGGRSATAGAARLRWRQALVAIEVALAVVLVVGAGLMIRSVRNLFAIDTGFRTDGVLTMRLSTPSTWYPDSVKVTVFHDE
ncbi:MAG: ABC transporter permease, partial [Gemmatimonadaceae bacterium]